MVRVKTDLSTDVHVKEMKDGEIAVLTQWSAFENYSGRVVVRFDGRLYTLGAISGESWAWDRVKTLNNLHRVRILPEGTELVI